MKKRIEITSKFEIQRYSRWLTVGPSLDQLTQITRNQYSYNSLLAMRKDWLHFVDFCQASAHRVLPASPLSLKAYIEVTARERKFSTLKRYVVTISNIHQMLGYPDPTATREVNLLLQQYRLEKSGDERTTTAFTKQHLQLLQDKLGQQGDSVSIRDLALYSLMFECALKRSELRDLCREQLSQTPSDESYKIELQGNIYQISNRSSGYLSHWLGLIQDDSPAVFRAIDKHGNISQEKLNDSSIFRIFQKASTLLGLPHNLSFSGQSARVGAVKELYDQGYKVKEIQLFGRWNTPVMPNYYLGNSSQAELGKMVFKSFKKLD